MANRFLNNITINDAYTLPLADGTAGQAITTDGAGNLSFGTVAAGTADAALKITLRVKNVSGSALSAGTLVRVAPSASPPSGNVLEVDIADNSSASTMPAIGILTSSLANEAEGDAVAFGRASGFSTIGFTEGDPVWVGSNGALTGTKPIGSNLIQKVGQVIKVDSSNGSIEVFGAGRTNDVPNLTEGKIWVGSTGNTVESTTVHLNDLLGRVGINTETPTATLDVVGTTELNGLTTINNSLNVTGTVTGSDISTGGLSASNGVVLNGGISSIGSVGDTYAIGTDGVGSLIIGNNSIPYSAFVVNNDYIRFINGSSGDLLTLTESSISGVDMAINNVDGYLCTDEGGAYPDNNGFVKLSSTRSEFRTHFDGSASNSSKIYITQYPINGSAEIEHEGINNSANFTIKTNETLNLQSGNEIRIEAGSFSPIYLGQSTYFSSSFNYIAGWVRVSGGIEATDDVIAFYSSDKRLKDNIEQIPNAIDKIQSIGGYSFNWNDKQDTYEVGSRDIGVIAQEIEEVLPELVTTRDNGYKAVKYEKMVALLIEGIKEQQEQINELKNKLDGITN